MTKCGLQSVPSQHQVSFYPAPYLPTTLLLLDIILFIYLFISYKIMN